MAHSMAGRRISKIDLRGLAESGDLLEQVTKMKKYQ
jgi:hypothetical protein